MLFCIAPRVNYQISALYKYTAFIIIIIKRMNIKSLVGVTQRIFVRGDKHLVFVLADPPPPPHKPVILV